MMQSFSEEDILSRLEKSYQDVFIKTYERVLFEAVLLILKILCVCQKARGTGQWLVMSIKWQLSMKIGASFIQLVIFSNCFILFRVTVMMPILGTLGAIGRILGVFWPCLLTKCTDSGTRPGNLGL